ncbi:MAG: hypothetical protein L6420_10705 [Elusimicrobia bacterium]|nr:hypothetical protein [Elusimicrobiota bacterium]
MNKYRINKNGLFEIISAWSAFFKRNVRLIACGGTAMTLLNIKESTKDIDFIAPDIKEHKYLSGKLTELGYKQVSQFGWKKDEGFVFDLYPGNKVYMTELLESPLKPGNNVVFKEFANVYIGILNYYDILITKLFRSSGVDIEDCLSLIKAIENDIDLKIFEDRFRKTASFDVSEEKNLKNLEYFLRLMKQKGIK